MSRLVIDYYRDEAERQGVANLYDERTRGVLPRIEDLSRRGVEAAFVLHVLICTWLGRLTPNWQTWPSRPLEAPGTRRAMLRAVRTLKRLGPDTIIGLFGGNQGDRGARFHEDLGILEQLLAGGTYRNPAFQIGGPRAPSARQQEVYRRACLACLMSALKGQPKCAAEVAVLLKGFALLPAGAGRRSEWVKRRYRLDERDLKDPLSPLGSLVRLLRATFKDIREHLAPEPIKPVPRERLVRQARRWRIPVAVYDRLFRDFCQLAPAKPNAKGLKEFEASLKANSRMRGGRKAYRKLLLEGSPSPVTTT